MNGMRVVVLIKQHASRPWVLQLISAVFFLLMLWELISGVGLFSRLNHEIQLHDVKAHEKKGGVSEMAVSSNVNHSFFGDYVPKNLDAAGVRQSMLNLIVVGVLFAVNEDDSQVILQKPNGQEQFFHVGDELPGGGVIKRITAEGVLVSRDGILERLSLLKDELNFEAPAEPMPFDTDGRTVKE